LLKKKSHRGFEQGKRKDQREGVERIELQRWYVLAIAKNDQNPMKGGGYGTPVLCETGAVGWEEMTPIFNYRHGKKGSGYLQDKRRRRKTY